ncbi:MAG TPA: aspartyl/asparaginyl beta-hydroxylase domain-containing protein [Pyrinomonadaceae bacterium]|nr:aspartyl/asparaginyl beta-hydroxylase domain-containing protein [Pyrinomonadaceae bacterium]
MISRFKLPFSFDPKCLKLDLAQITRDDWVAHFNTGYFEGQWTGVALRSVGGVASQLYADPRANRPIVDTPILDRCPNIRAVLSRFQCPIRSARLLRLAPGSIIREHRDYDLGYEEGQLRLHVPIVTNADVDFFLDAHRIEMSEGECWYLDLSLPHWVENRGSTDRVHLVIDCTLNEWLGALLPDEPTESKTAVDTYHESAEPPDDLDRFRHLVLSDLALQHRLRQTSDRESFIRLVVSLGRERGYRFSATHAENAMQAAQRAWIEQWID